MKGWKVERKVGRFKGFCHFPCFQTLLEKVGRLERWNSCIIPPIRAQFDRAERRRREARREKCTRDKCTLPTIPLGPAGRRPARKVGRLEGLNVERLEGWKVGRLEGWNKRLESWKA